MFDKAYKLRNLMSLKIISNSYFIKMSIDFLTKVNTIEYLCFNSEFIDQRSLR